MTENDIQDPAAVLGQQPDFEPPTPAASANGTVEVRPPSPPPTEQAQQSRSAPTGRRRGAPVPPPTGVGAAPVAKPVGRPRGKAGEVPESFDPNASGAPKWSSHEAEVLWPELMQWLAAKGFSAYDVMVNVIRVEPPGRAGIGDPFEASACVGDGTNTPSSQLKYLVEEHYHLGNPRWMAPARYELQFVWKQNGQYIVNGYLSLNSRDEIVALRTAQYNRRLASLSQQQQQPIPGLGAPPGMGMPRLPPMPQPQYSPYAQQQPYGYPPNQYGYPPPQQPQTDPAIMRRLEALEAENARLRAQPAPVYRPPHSGVGAPPPVVHPPPQAITQEGLATAIATAMRAVGLGAGGQQDQMVTGMRTALQVMKEFRSFADEASGIFEPDEGPEKPIPMLPAPAEVQDSPYDVTEFASTWDDGTKPKLARDKETGKIDVLATAMLNPRPAQRLMNAGAMFLEGYARRNGFAGAPEEEQQQFQPPAQQQQFQPPPPQQQLPPAPSPQEHAPPSPPPKPNSGEPDDGWGSFGA